MQFDSFITVHLYNEIGNVICVSRLDIHSICRLDIPAAGILSGIKDIEFLTYEFVIELNGCFAIT